MVKLPPQFIALDKYPGYFWNTDDEMLYSVKVVGALKPLQKRLLWQNNMPVAGVYGFSISQRGQKIFLSLEKLRKLKPGAQTYPIWKDPSTP